MRELSRRKVVSKVLPGAALSSAMLSAPYILADSKKKFRWRLALVINKSLPIWAESVDEFARNVHTMSQGQLDIKVYGAGELVPALGVFDAVKAGQIEMAHSASYYWQGKMPAAPFFTAVPFGLNANGMRAWLAEGGAQQLWDELYDGHGVFALPAGNTGLQMGGWFRKAINSIDDFKGLKMRIPGLGGNVIEKAGAKPILVAGSEIFTNLSTGVIDATEWIGPYHDYIMGFHKASQYYYYPGWHEPGPVLELLINKKAWNELSVDLQAIIRCATAKMDRDIYARWLAKDSEYLEKIKHETKIKILPFPQAVLKKLKSFADDVLAEVSKQGKLEQKIHESFSKFRNQYQTHQQATEWAFIDAMKA